MEVIPEDDDGAMEQPQQQQQPLEANGLSLAGPFSFGDHAADPATATAVVPFPIVPGRAHGRGGRQHHRQQRRLRLRLRSKRIQWQRRRRTKRLEIVQQTIDSLPSLDQRTKPERQRYHRLLKRRERIVNRIAELGEEDDDDQGQDVDIGVLGMDDDDRFPPSLLAAAASPSNRGSASGWHRNRSMQNRKRNQKKLASIPEDPVLAAGLASLQQSLGSLGLSTANNNISNSESNSNLENPNSPSPWSGDHTDAAQANGATAPSFQLAQQWNSTEPQVQPSDWIMGRSSSWRMNQSAQLETGNNA